MFTGLTKKFQEMFSGLVGKKELTEGNVAQAAADVRAALLEADVNFSVAQSFVDRVKAKALGTKVLRSVSAGEHFIKIVHEELVQLMGGEESPLALKGKPTVLLLCGLQGSGKTTQCVKLAAHMKKRLGAHKVLIAACDRQRPAAIAQLQTLAQSIEVPVFTLEGESDPVKVGVEAERLAEREGYDVLIVDTAGRLHVNEELMQELKRLKEKLKPKEILFVANAATGQDAVKTALEFDQRVGVTGSILTMLDGTARAGAALSIREITKKPLMFEGIGEKIEDLQPFNPHSMADRILGMGDVINLVRRAQEHVDEEEAQDLEQKMRKGAFTYQDYLKQMGAVRKMGSFKSLLGMLPGMSSLGEVDVDDEEFHKMEAMIRSMTQGERIERVELLPNRRRRIAKGSGTQLDDVNRMVKNFKRLKQMCKELPKWQKAGKFPFGGLGGL